MNAFTFPYVKDVRSCFKEIDGTTGNLNHFSPETDKQKYFNGLYSFTSLLLLISRVNNETQTKDEKQEHSNEVGSRSLRRAFEFFPDKYTP